jgi:hypothetical protein
MNILRILEDEYPGDAAWGRFSDCYDGVDQRSIESVDTDPDIAKVLLYKIGAPDKVNDWLNTQLPALDGKSAASLLKEPKGRLIVRSFVMRLP